MFVRRDLQPRLRIVLSLKPILYDLELKRPNSPEKRHPLHDVGLEVLLHHALLEKLLESLTETFELRCGGGVQVGEGLRHKTRGLIKLNVGDVRERIADPQIVIAHHTHDIASIGLIQRLAVAGKDALRVCQAYTLLGADIRHEHVAFKSTRNDSDEVNAIPMAGIHVRLDLKHKSREGVRRRLDHGLTRFSRSRWRSHFQERVEE